MAETSKIKTTDPVQIAAKSYLSTEEVAIFYSLSRREIDKLRETGTIKGKLPYIRLKKEGGKTGTILFNRKDIDMFLEKHKVESQIA